MRTESAAPAIRIPATIRSFNARDAIRLARPTRSTAAYEVTCITALIAIRAIRRTAGARNERPHAAAISLDRANENCSPVPASFGAAGICAGAYDEAPPSASVD